ncbi:hypothetical protein Tco_0985573 [Tanacetum coccineum]
MLAISSTLLMCLTTLSVGSPEKEILCNSLRSCPLISNVELSGQRRDEKEEIRSLETRSNNVSDQEIMVVKEIEDGLLEEMEKFGWWFEQDIDGESEDDNEKKLVMVNEEGWMS